LSKEYLTIVQADYIFVYITVLVKPLGCCSMRHRILFSPTYSQLTAQT